MNKIIRTIFEGVYDEECILNCLLGTPHIVKQIWFLVKDWYKSHIKLPKIYDQYEYEGTDEVTLENDVFLPDYDFVRKIEVVKYVVLNYLLDPLWDWIEFNCINQSRR